MNQKKRVLQIIISIVIGIATVACVGILTAAWVLTRGDLFSSDDVSPESIEANAEIDLPPSARDIHVHEEGVTEIFTMVRFTMDVSELDVFMQSTNCTTPLSEVDPAQYGVLEGRPWWRPMDAVNLQECISTDEDLFQRILIDMTDPDAYIVYVLASTH